MRDYVKEFQEKIAEIEGDTRDIYIVNAGVMNHGKSSLFNSLTDTDTFVAQDIRTTEISQTEKWREHAYLVDTPGLAAEDADDSEAYAAYRRANVILFVHTAKVGELKELELSGINRIKALFGSEKFFWDHFCLVITFLDSDSEESIKLICEKSLSDIEKFCGGTGFKVFVVSNTRYRKGRDEGKPPLLEKSGIPSLREYLLGNIDGWLVENEEVRKARIQREKADMIARLGEETARVRKAIQSKETRIMDRQKHFLKKVENVVSEWRSDEGELRSKTSMLNEMKGQLSGLRDQHQRARASY